MNYLAFVLGGAFVLAAVWAWNKIQNLESALRLKKEDCKELLERAIRNEVENQRLWALFKRPGIAVFKDEQAEMMAHIIASHLTPTPKLMVQ